MKKDNISYAVCDYNFFSKGHGGKVSHALGIANGLNQEVNDFSFLVPDKSLSIVRSKLGHPNVTCVPVTPPVTSFFYPLMVISKALKVSDLAILRKNALVIFLFYLTLGFICFGGVKNKVVWEVNGLSFESLKEKNFLSFIYLFVKLLTKVALKKSLKVYVVSSSIKDELCRGFLRLPKSHVVVIKNGAPELQARITKCEKSQVNFIFFGVFRPYNEFDVVIRAFERFNKSQGGVHRLHFVGYGPEKGRINEMSRKLSTVYLWPPASISDLSEHASTNGFVFGLVPIANAPGSNFLSPIKLYEYAALGIPVIVSSVYNATDFDCHFRYEAGDEDSLVETMANAVGRKIEYDKLVKSSYYFAEKNSWKNRMKSLVEVL